VLESEDIFQSRGGVTSTRDGKRRELVRGGVWGHPGEERNWTLEGEGEEGIEGRVKARESSDAKAASLVLSCLFFRRLQGQEERTKKAQFLLQKW